MAKKFKNKVQNKFKQKNTFGKWQKSSKMKVQKNVQAKKIM